MTVVVGGTYREKCREPAIDRVYGSGARAAKVLGDQLTRFVTVVDPRTRLEMDFLLDDALIEATPRNSPIEFLYGTPISSPYLFQDPLDTNIVVPDISTEDVIVFGMVEACPKVNAQRAIIDPQYSLRLEEVNSAITAEDLIVVANSREVLQLAGADDIETAVHRLFGHPRVRGVVVKAGALGALVFQHDGEVSGVPALMTPSINPIGSGDVFTAELAHRYFAGDDLITSAFAASERTAVYVATEQLAPLDVPDEWIRAPVPTLVTVQQPPSVYVAASFATPEQRWSASTITHGIEDIGGKSIYPLRDVGPKTDACVTAEKDLDELDACNALLILADVARTGPFFEGGWAAARNIPAVVVSSDPNEDRYTMLRGTGAKVVGDLATGAYHSVWAALAHKHALGDGERVILLSGGLDSATVAAVERPERALFVDYGQEAATAERDSARKIARLLDIELAEVTVNASHVGSGALVNREQPDLAPSPEWFPFRNQLLVTIAAAYAIDTGLHSVLLGTVAHDALRHADGKHRFIASLDAVLRSQEGELRLAAPHADTSTRQLLARTAIRDEIVAATHSCDVANIACGECNSCQRRAAILDSLGAKA